MPFAVRIDDECREVLHVADLVLGAESDFVHWVPGNPAAQGRRFKAQDFLPRVLLSPSGGERPQFSFQVGDDGRMRPRQEGRDDQAYALARAGGGEREDVFLAVVPQVNLPAPVVDPGADVDAVVGEESSFGDVPAFRPAGRAMQIRHRLPGVPGGRFARAK